MQRYFSNKLTNNYFELKSDDVYHIKTVMRMKQNDLIEVVYKEKLYLAKMIINDQTISFIKEKEIESSLNKKIYKVLFLPLLKEDKFSFIIEKATELGVDEIIPFETQRSIIKYDEKKLSTKYIRWQKIVKEASEQSKRLTIPIIKPLVTIDNINNLEGLKIICSTTEQQNSLKEVIKKEKFNIVNIVVGPEGGLTNEEEQKFVNKKFIPTTLGKQILRVETAPIYVLSNINYEIEN